MAYIGQNGIALDKKEGDKKTPEGIFYLGIAFGMNATIDNNKIELLQTRSVNNMEHCKKCSVRNHCGGYCLGEVQNETGNLFGQKPNTCRAIKRLAESIGYSDEPYAFMHP